MFKDTKLKFKFVCSFVLSYFYNIFLLESPND